MGKCETWCAVEAQAHPRGKTTQAVVNSEYMYVSLWQTKVRADFYFLCKWMTKIRSVGKETIIIPAVLFSYLQQNNSTALSNFFFSFKILFNDYHGIPVLQRLDAWPIPISI